MSLWSHFFGPPCTVQYFYHCLVMVIKDSNTLLIRSQMADKEKIKCCKLAS